MNSDIVTNADNGFIGNKKTTVRNGGLFFDFQKKIVDIFRNIWYYTICQEGLTERIEWRERKMTMDERKAESIRKEIEKLEKRLVREQGTAAKKAVIAEKCNATCTSEEWFAGMREAYTAEQQNAWFDAHWANEHVRETEEAIAKAYKRLEKVTGLIADRQEAEEENRKEVEHIEGIENRFIAVKQISEEEYQKWLEEFKAECLKDGVVIEEANGRYFSGLTKSGEKFWLVGNWGITTRSRHCYSLEIGGAMIFTSGEFFTAYRYIKR